jgi:hypothetical protein
VPKILYTEGVAIKSVTPEKATQTIDAVPDPVPALVAVNTTPTVLEEAPIKVKLVDPTATILYCCPVLNEPADVKNPLLA